MPRICNGHAFQRLTKVWNCRVGRVKRVPIRIKLSNSHREMLVLQSHGTGKPANARFAILPCLPSFVTKNCVYQVKVLNLIRMGPSETSPTMFGTGGLRRGSALFPQASSLKPQLVGLADQAALGARRPTLPLDSPCHGALYFSWNIALIDVPAARRSARPCRIHLVPIS